MNTTLSSNNKDITNNYMATLREENQKELLKQLEDIFLGRVEDVPMTGSILCGKTADDVLREIKDRENK